jgi:DNA-binding LacI/PurR family transcriptional regulator
VGSDNEAGGHDATAHLLAQGCRRIAFLGDPAAPEVAARLQGYLRALAAAKVQSPSNLQVPVRFGSDMAYHAVSGLLGAGVTFDGVVACSDVFALGAMRALSESGRKVPADVAVIGFDDVSFAAHTVPPLTTVRQDCRAGARQLVESLLRTMRREPACAVVIPSTLVVRASSLREHYRALPSLHDARRRAAPVSRARRRRSG